MVLDCTYGHAGEVALLKQGEGLVGDDDAVDRGPGRSGLDSLLKVQEGGRAGGAETLAAAQGNSERSVTANKRQSDLK